MKIYKDYVLVSELTKKAKKSDAWLFSLKSIELEHMGSVPVVQISQLADKYQKIAQQCVNLEDYYVYASFSEEIGRTRDFLSVFDFQRKENNKPVMESILVGRKRLLKLSKEFIENINNGLTPYKLRQSNKETDFTKVITMQYMKIGFY